MHKIARKWGERCSYSGKLDASELQYRADIRLMGVCVALVAFIMALEIFA